MNVVPNYSLLWNKRTGSDYIKIKELTDNEPVQEENLLQISKILNLNKQTDQSDLAESWNATVDENLHRSIHIFSTVTNKIISRETLSISSMTENAPRVSKIYQSQYKSAKSINENNRESLGSTRSGNLGSKTSDEGTNTVVYTKCPKDSGSNKNTKRDSGSNSGSELDMYKDFKNYRLPKTTSINLINVDQMEIAKPLIQTLKIENDISPNRAVNKSKKSSRFEYYKTPSFHNLYNTKFTKKSIKNSIHSKMDYLTKSGRNSGIKKWYSQVEIYN